MFRRAASVVDESVGVALADVVGLLRSGAAVDDAWTWAGVDADGLGEPGGAGARAAGRLATRTGAPLAPILAAVGAEVRAVEDSVAARDAALAGPRLSARVLSWLPAAGVAMAAVVDPRTLVVLASTPLGWCLAGLAIALAVAGRWWMRRLVNAAVRTPADGGDSMTLALVAGACAAGLDVRRALDEVARALETPSAQSLARVADALSSGSSWPEAWSATVTGPPDAVRAALARALRSAWERGAAPAPLLEVAAEALARERRRTRERAVGELSVRLTIPLALCLLPAFVVGGIAPLLIAVVRGAAQ